MDDCICNKCLNLKKVFDDDSEEEYKCEFGYPSDKCCECEEQDGDCNIICNHYKEDNNEYVIVKCLGCGKELKQACQEDSEKGEIYCVNCYLNKE
ncbi:UNVERIFIED_CONTAM: hypothetical protein Cloal_2629 [Acetivibrio alkalicellulosi]